MHHEGLFGCGIIDGAPGGRQPCPPYQSVVHANERYGCMGDRSMFAYNLVRCDGDAGAAETSLSASPTSPWLITREPLFASTPSLYSCVPPIVPGSKPRIIITPPPLTPALFTSSCNYAHREKSTVSDAATLMRHDPLFSSFLSFFAFRGGGCSIARAERVLNLISGRLFCYFG